MSSFLQGRLFWKILFFFFLAQATTVIGTGLAIWATMPAGEIFPPPPVVMESRPPGSFRDLPPPPAAPPFAENPGRPAPPGPRLPFLHLIAGSIVSLVFATLLAAYIARPVGRLRQALQAGAAGQLATDIADTMGHRRDELADLCRDFDRMAHHIDQLMQGQRRLMHDVSHEMRSPLARLSAIVGLLRQQPERLDDCLNLLEHESARMDRLVSELLTLSRLESGMVDPGEEVIDLAEVLADVVGDAAPEAEQAACRIDLDAGAEALVRGDAEMLHRVFDNLVRNALAYAASGGWVGYALIATKLGSGSVSKIAGRACSAPISSGCSSPSSVAVTYRSRKATGWDWPLPGKSSSIITAGLKPKTVVKAACGLPSACRPLCRRQALKACD